jgi:hypothetical protein
VLYYEDLIDDFKSIPELLTSLNLTDVHLTPAVKCKLATAGISAYDRTHQGSATGGKVASSPYKQSRHLAQNR